MIIMQVLSTSSFLTTKFCKVNFANIFLDIHYMSIREKKKKKELFDSMHKYLTWFVELA